MNREEIEAVKREHFDRRKRRRRILRDIDAVTAGSHLHRELILRLATQDREIGEIEARLRKAWEL